MTTPTIAPYRSELRTGQDGFAQLLWSEWTKFRTVRGWVVAIVLAGLVMVGIDLISGGECGMQNGGVISTGCPEPLGPGGEAVTDSFYFVHQPLAANGAITARVTSMTGSYSPNGSPGQQAQAPLQPWSKAGILIKATTNQGSAYAAIMVTGSHGVQMQYDYTGDIAGAAGNVSAASPRWLRLTRSGDLITGYASADGTHWSKVGTATLTGLPSTAQAGFSPHPPPIPRRPASPLPGPPATAAPPRPPPPSTASPWTAPRPAAYGTAPISAAPTLRTRHKAAGTDRPPTGSPSLGPAISLRRCPGDRPPKAR